MTRASNTENEPEFDEVLRFQVVGWREKHRKTQTELAELIGEGATQSIISAFENSKSMPRKPILNALVRLMKSYYSLDPNRPQMIASETPDHSPRKVYCETHCAKCEKWVPGPQYGFKHCANCGSEFPKPQLPRRSWPSKTTTF